MRYLIIYLVYLLLLSCCGGNEIQKKKQKTTDTIYIKQHDVLIINGHEFLRIYERVFIPDETGKKSPYIISCMDHNPDCVFCKREKREQEKKIKKNRK